MSRGRSKRGIESHPIVQRFVPLAREYCNLIESGTRGRIKLLRGCGEMLPELLSLALRLPDLNTSSRVQNEVRLAWNFVNARHGLTPERREKAEKSRYRHAVISISDCVLLRRRISRVLGDFDYYHMVFHPYGDGDSIGHTLADDLADIWRDLKEGLLVFDVGDESSRRYAVWSWRFHALIHWGLTHVTSALKPIVHILRACENRMPVEREPWNMLSRLRRRKRVQKKSPR